MNKKQDTIPVRKTLQDFSSYLKSKEKPEKEPSGGEMAYLLWHSRIDSTLRWRAEYWNGDKMWENAYRMYSGKHWKTEDNDNPSSDDPRDLITVKITGSTIQNIVPFLLNAEAQFKVTPRKPSSVTSAKLQEAALNYEYKHREMQDEIRRVVYDSEICGTGILKTGFVLEIDEAITKASGEIVYDDYIQEESPYIRRVCPKNFIKDPTAADGTLTTARWCGEVFFQPVADILSNSSYLKSTLDKIKAGEFKIQTKDTAFTHLSQDVSWESNDLDCENDSQLGVLYEIWDKKFRKVYVFAKGVVPPLMEKDWPYPYLREFPYIERYCIDLPDEPYGVGVPFLIQDQQYELNRNRTAQFGHRRRFNRKYWALSSVEESELTKLQEGEDGTIVVIEQPNSIGVIPDAAMSSDLQVTEAVIKDDIRQLTGADALIQGGQLPSRTTAGEISARGSLFITKLDERIGSVNKLIRKAGEQVLKHIKANYITPKVIRIAGSEGEYWEEFSVEDIQDEVDVEVSSVAAPKTDPTLERQQAIQILQMATTNLAPLIQAGLVQIDLNELFKWVLSKMDIKDASRFFKPAGVLSTPIQEPSSSNLNPSSAPNTEIQSTQDLSRQAGLAATLNSSGLQL